MQGVIALRNTPAKDFIQIATQQILQNNFPTNFQWDHLSDGEKMSLNKYLGDIKEKPPVFGERKINEWLPKTLEQKFRTKGGRPTYKTLTKNSQARIYRLLQKKPDESKDCSLYYYLIKNTFETDDEE